MTGRGEAPLRVVLLGTYIQFDTRLYAFGLAAYLFLSALTLTTGR